VSRAARSKGSPTGGPSARADAGTAFEQEFPGLSQSANASVMALVQVGESFLAMVDRTLRHHRLSQAGRQALAVLEGAGQPLSPTTLAERLIVTTASVTSLLDTLERRGLVQRRPDPTDRRRLLVALTDDGRALVEQFLPEVVALQTAVMAGLSETQRLQLLRLLAKVRDGMANTDPEAVVRDAPRRGGRRPG
jgi:DNA-binding MarR family transcriptional regulator